MRTGVVIFPGTHGDRDCIETFRDVLGWPTVSIHHRVTTLPPVDLVVLPGGFSFGDYLRPGAIAALLPVISAVRHHAQRGGYVLGICNGFQILTEAGLLDGALANNDHGYFVHRNVWIQLEMYRKDRHQHAEVNNVYRLPIAHKTGRFVASPHSLAELEDSGRIIARYCGSDGVIHKGANPNGSLNNIAGICNISRNIIGLMPHPERASSESLGNTDGIGFLRSLERLW